MPLFFLLHHSRDQAGLVPGKGHRLRGPWGCARNGRTQEIGRDGPWDGRGTGSQADSRGWGAVAEAGFGLGDGPLRVRLVGSSEALPEVFQMTRRWGMGAGDLPLLLRAWA